MEEVIIKADNGRTVFVDQFDEGLWLSIQVQGGSAHTVLTREQAEQLLAAVQQVLEVTA